MKNIQFAPVFVQTKNVRTFGALMDGLLASRGDQGDERLACIWGRAGRGKTRTVQSWAARNGAPYLETVSVWTELDFLRALCLELGVRQVPHRRGTCFALCVEALAGMRRPLFVDEIERFGQRFLEMIRDLAKIANAAIVLIGEEELPYLMKQNRRVWSRTYRSMEFDPVGPSDILLYVSQTTGLTMTEEAIRTLFDASDGDLRVVRRDTVNLVHLYNQSQHTDGRVDAEMASAACSRALQGGK